MDARSARACFSSRAAWVRFVADCAALLADEHEAEQTQAHDSERLLPVEWAAETGIGKRTAERLRRASGITDERPRRAQWRQMR